MRTTVKLSVPEMVGFIKTIGTRSMFVSLDTATVLEPGKKIKKSCPYGAVTKQATVTGWLNINYNEAVHRRIAAKLGLSVVETPKYENGVTWFKHVMTEDGKATPVVVHATKDNGKFYLFYFHRKTTEAKYFGASGEPITYEQLKPHFYATGSNEFKPEVRCIELANVKCLRARGLIAKASAQ